MLYTAAPSTCPAGSNPVLRIAANSFVDRAEPQVPLRRISAIRARATEGRPLPAWPSATARPLPNAAEGPALSHTIPGRAACPGHGPSGCHGARVTDLARPTPRCAYGPSPAPAPRLPWSDTVPAG